MRPPIQLNLFIQKSSISELNYPGLKKILPERISRCLYCTNQASSSAAGTSCSMPSRTWSSEWLEKEPVIAQAVLHNCQPIMAIEIQRLRFVVVAELNGKERES